MSQQLSGPPYAPTTWALGGIPKGSVDIPITSVFLALFVAAAATHMTIFQLNKRASHKFLFSGATFGFCMSRIVTTILRLATITHPRNVRLMIAAQIFVAAGVLILFVINIIFARRLLRTTHPKIGGSAWLEWVLRVHWSLIPLMLAMVITGVVQSYYTLNTDTRSIDRALQLTGQSYFMYLAFLPLPMLAFSWFGRNSVPLRLDSASSSSTLDVNAEQQDRTLKGPLTPHFAILLTSTILLTLGASYRAGTSYLTPLQRSEHPQPASMAKAAFYLINFGIEIIVVVLFAVTRVDRKFWVPDRVKKGEEVKDKKIRDQDEDESEKTDASEV